LQSWTNRSISWRKAQKTTRSVIAITMLINRTGEGWECVRTELEWRIAGVLLLAMLQKPGAANVLLLLLLLQLKWEAWTPLRLGFVLVVVVVVVVVAAAAVAPAPPWSAEAFGPVTAAAATFTQIAAIIGSNSSLLQSNPSSQALWCGKKQQQQQEAGWWWQWLCSAFSLRFLCNWATTRREALLR
jgi:hypothetical protein